MSTSNLIINTAKRPRILRCSILGKSHHFKPVRSLTTLLSSPYPLDKPGPSRSDYHPSRPTILKNSWRPVHQDASTTPTPHSSIHPQPQTNSSPSSPFATLISTPKRSCEEDDSSAPSIVKPIGIKISPSAIEQIERARKMDNKPNEVLRLSVESGGCHGFQYKIGFTESAEDDDFVFTVGNRNGLVVIDEGSLGLMDGSTIEFATELIGSSFRILDNPHSAGKGCGCGVSWELK
ncbi:uncharacterized protein PGTG_00182 [Puccinia graminis f. sp. tritici CRL 75-36-700-3]|uniref:Core domain-containing protein n=1 Tax=Puccinia graminis f. sp. tritici (strain CRL 75-36-700-3 / race SCCL) TaxID=418459 RepID=E3JQE7_PUCGT|nr:uncharacterized protein PGTG_00182 [Puccinia graminis f. sp. tritici CRL 75-36-700-3]EFP74226.2 hypothetical protein PGTG_00182 [Puccinia graminis f. sp. tritici CRL 75-36-700-3]